MQIRKAAEDYLEAMLVLREENGRIRSIDVARMLNVKKPSVTYATRRLKEMECITMDADSAITLTEKGEAIARSIYTRHKAIASILMRLGVDEETAREDACRIEHDISEKSFEAILNHAKSEGII